jgi:hypothetical protein
MACPCIWYFYDKGVSILYKNEDSHVGNFQGKNQLFDLLSAEKLILRGAHNAQ